MDSESFMTERLRAEKLRPKHKAEIFLMHKEKRVMETLGELATKKEDVVGWLENNVNHWKRYGYGIWMFYDKETGDFVGRGGLRHDKVEGQEEIEVEYALMPECWGKGLGTEIGKAAITMAEKCKLKSVIAYTKTSHTASIRIMEKLGFVFDRTIQYRDAPHVLYRKALTYGSD